MPAGKCRKTVTLDYFHWVGEQDNEALLKWLVQNVGYVEDYIGMQGCCVWLTDGNGNLSDIEFNMEDTPYLIVDCCNLDVLKDGQFQSLCDIS